MARMAESCISLFRLSDSSHPAGAGGPRWCCRSGYIGSNNCTSLPALFPFVHLARLIPAITRIDTLRQLPQPAVDPGKVLQVAINFEQRAFSTAGDRVRIPPFLLQPFMANTIPRTPMRTNVRKNSPKSGIGEHNRPLPKFTRILG